MVFKDFGNLYSRDSIQSKEQKFTHNEHIVISLMFEIRLVLQQGAVSELSRSERHPTAQNEGNISRIEKIWTKIPKLLPGDILSSYFTAITPFPCKIQLVHKLK